MRSFVVGLTALVALSCAGGVEPDPCRRTSAVVNGSEAVPSELAAVADSVVALRLHGMINGQAFISLCSGALVDGGHVVTAAHCFEDDPAAAITLSTGILAESSSCSPTPAEAALRPRLHPLRDVAVLDGVVASGRASRVCMSVPAVGARAFVAGYGVDESGSIGARRFLETRVVGVTPDELEVQANDPAGACVGDSGGPLFVEDAAGWCVAGALSTGSADCRGSDHYELLVPLLPWLDSSQE